MLPRIFFIVLVLFAAGCAHQKDFNYAVQQINAANLKYNTTISTYPDNAQQIDSMLKEFKEIQKLRLATDQEPFDLVVEYRILNLEAERIYIESQKYGKSGTTKFGFGCKIRPLITESAALRNQSAIKGFKSVDLLRKLVGNYPEKAKSAGLSLKDALFLNASFYQISNDARKDSSVINHFCPVNITLGLYQEEIRKRTNLSEDFINNLSYGGAVPIWKKIRGIS